MAKLARWQIWLLTLSGGTLWLTGVVWLLLHYFGQVQGDFGPETNPFEPWMLRLHGLAMIASLLGVGSLLAIHIVKGWQHRRQRLVGIFLLGIVGLLVVTGYLLYYVGDDDRRWVISTLHWSVGLVLPTIFLIHYRRAQSIRRTIFSRQEDRAMSRTGFSD
jgi:hypothetical protein